MRLSLVVAAAGALLVIGLTGRAGARPEDTFVLEAYDTLVAESPGCHTDCAPQGSKRVCRVKDLDCRAVCRTIPECKPEGAKSVQACAVVKTRAF